MTPSEAEPARARPSISVVFATRHQWQETASFLDRIEVQVRAVGGELLVVDGGGAMPSEPDDAVSCIRSPGSDVYQLRALGAARARGEIVAYTEDHCMVAPDWCEQILRAHHDHPDAAMIAGAVLNGSEERTMDRANFLMVHAPNLPPLREVPTDWVPSSANVSFKHAALPDRVPDPGWVEYVLTAELIRSGRVAMSDRIRVSHVQSYGIVGTTVNHYHAAPSVAGHHRQLRPTMGRRMFARAALTYPFDASRRTLRVARQKPAYASGVWWMVAPMLLLACSATVGLLTGTVAGPGVSPCRMR